MAAYPEIPFLQGLPEFHNAYRYEKQGKRKQGKIVGNQVCKVCLLDQQSPNDIDKISKRNNVTDRSDNTWNGLQREYKAG